MQRTNSWVIYEGVFVFGMTVMFFLPFPQIGPDSEHPQLTIPISVNHEL